MAGTRRRWGFGIAAMVVLAASVLWLGTITYTCPDLVEPGDSSCEGQGGVEMVSRTIVALIGLGVAIWFAVKAIRHPRD